MRRLTWPNLPNQLTLARILLALAMLHFLFEKFAGSKLIALALFLLASLTDYLDGEIARQKKMITPFGKLMDPIADKVLTLSAFMGFVQLGILPAWMVLLIVFRDLLITGLRLIMPPGKEEISARKSGKHKTALQFASICGILIFLSLYETSYWNRSWTVVSLWFIYYGMAVVVAVTLWSGIRYLLLNKKFLLGG